MKIQMLIENLNNGENSNLISEHGLSLYIESNNKRILFDTGKSGKFADNAQKLGVDLSLVDFAVISHGYHDHGGGLRRFFEINKNANVYMKAGAEKEYRAVSESYNRYIGIDKDIFSEFGDRIIFINKFSEIFDNFYIITDITEFFEKDATGKNLFKLEKE